MKQIKKTNKKEELYLARKILLALIITLTVLTSMLIINVKKEYKLIRATFEDINERMEQNIKEMEIELKTLEYEASRERFCSLSYVDCFEDNEWTARDVIFTNYYQNDSTGSGDITASGKKIKDFEINEDGFYTYEGKVVVATANTTRLKRNLYKGYKSHELYDELTFELNGKRYKGIVLDVCGACYGVSHENIQRYDIFTTKSIIGKTTGLLYERGDWNKIYNTM